MTWLIRTRASSASLRSMSRAAPWLLTAEGMGSSKTQRTVCGTTTASMGKSIFSEDSILENVNKVKT